MRMSCVSLRRREASILACRLEDCSWAEDWETSSRLSTGSSPRSLTASPSTVSCCCRAVRMLCTSCALASNRVRAWLWKPRSSLRQASVNWALRESSSAFCPSIAPTPRLTCALVLASITLPARLPCCTSSCSITSDLLFKSSFRTVPRSATVCPSCAGATSVPGCGFGTWTNASAMRRGRAPCCSRMRRANSSNWGTSSSPAEVEEGSCSLFLRFSTAWIALAKVSPAWAASLW
mmetsp:Transcript_20790/g.45793  ORF Transcript_20790/g.45793 Transcript_20790/m.45793 type:complete len:235 (-) Transcript_20790:407-1111(-)